MSAPASGKAAQNVFLRIFQNDLAGGGVLFAAGLLAIVAANSEALAPHYAHWLHAPVGVVLGGHVFAFSAAHFINDGLMAVFFLMVGLEIKRELLAGELSNRGAALLPAVAAVAGMAAPAAVYAYFNFGDATAMRGWAIPSATDIAFSLGVLSLLGKRVPVVLKVFLTAVAVLDDLGAIAIIALFYTAKLNAVALALAFLALGFLFLLNRNNVYARWPYVIGFLALWVCVLNSGVHATLAGVATALAVPLRNPPANREPLLTAMEKDLHSFVTFVILPVFAFANAGVSLQNITFASLAQPITLGIAAGLVLGKVVGISGGVWLAVKSGWSALPPGCSWSSIVSVAFLCGIGFTVSLFIGNLAFADAAAINQVKIGVLFGSAVAGVAGYLMLRFVAFRRPPAAAA